MARKPDNTDEEIYQYISDYFTEHGREPTVAELSREIGGSNERLGRALRKWHADRMRARDAMHRIPDRFLKQAEHACASMWVLCETWANDQIEQAIAASDKRTTELERDLDQALQQVDEISARHEQLQTLSSSTQADIKAEREARLIAESRLEELRRAYELLKASPAVNGAYRTDLVQCAT